MNRISNNSPAQIENNLPEGVTATGEGKSRQYHHDKTTFAFSSRKWHFTATGPDGKLFTAILSFPNKGGIATAARIAPLVQSDVTRHGRLGGNRANINRLIQHA